MLLAGLNQLPFKQKVLSQTILVLCSLNIPAYAMQVLDDDSMSDTTGEGIAFTINTANMQFNSADDAGAGNANTGYIRYIPVGALSQTVTDNNAAVALGCGGASPPGGCTAAQIASASKYNVQIGKGDIYLYGLALSANDNDANTLRSTGDIDIGTSANPMLIKVVTQPAVPNFVGAGTEDISYMGFEYPLYQASWSGATFNDTTAKNLKLGMWTDAFVRDASVAEGLGNQFWLNSPLTGNRNTSLTDTTQILRENRLRLQMVLNGFSLDGSNLKIFQTQTGATNANGLSTAYNDTFGLAAVMRINTGDSRGLKVAASYTDSGPVSNIGSITGWTTIHGGANTALNPATGAGDCNNTGTGSFNSTAVGCRYMIQNHTRTDSKTRTLTWTAPTASESKVLRLSTREIDDTYGLMATPSLAPYPSAPNFANTEGLYMYNPNINLVIGSIWQPVIVGVAPDNRNLYMEVTRIPNKPEIYKEIYTPYSGAQGSMSNADFAALNGSTCNIYQCGGTTTAGGYQTSNNAYFYENNNGTVSKLTAKNATHSSISIGTVNYDKANNLLTAYNGSDSIGVSFGALSNTLSASTSATSYEVRYQQRQELAQSWRSASRCTGSVLGNCTSTTEQTGSLYQWQYNDGSTFVTGSVAVPLPANVAICSTAAFNGNSGCSNVTPATSVDGINYPACPNNAPCFRYGTTSNRNWATSPAVWLQGNNGDQTAFNNFITASNGTMALNNLNTLPNQAVDPTIVSATPFNNLGSAAIDGLLIQHLKITTKGL